MDRTLFALLGEMEDETSSLDRQEFQTRLGRGLAEMNNRYAAYLYAPFVLGSGFPEFSAVLRTHAPVYGMARTLAEVCHPLPLRVAVARGEIDGGLESRDAEAMDGPAFDLAGELLYRARKEERLLLVHTGDDDFDTLFNALLLLLHRNFQQWTSRQWEVVRLYRELGRQSDVAQALDISQQSVSNTLSGAGWKVVKEVEDSLTRVLGEVQILPLADPLGV